MENQEAAIEQTMKAIDAAGMFTVLLSDNVINVYSEPMANDEYYLFTLTVTTTP